MAPGAPAEGACGASDGGSAAPASGGPFNGGALGNTAGRSVPG